MNKDLYRFTAEEVESSQLLALRVFKRVVLAPEATLDSVRQLQQAVAEADAEVASDYEALTDEERAGEIGDVMRAYRRSRAAMAALIEQHIARLEYASSK